MKSRQMKTKYSNESGFTLVEVLIAGAISVFGLLVMGSFSESIVSQNSASEYETLAASLAEEKLEDLRGNALVADLTEEDNSSDTVTTTAGTFTRTWTIEEDFASTADRITVLVDWAGKGDTQLSFDTLVNN